MKLSTTQVAALRGAISADGRLFRWPGGFWLPQRPSDEQARARDEPPNDLKYGPDGRSMWHGVRTVRGLETRGLVARAHEYPEEWRDTRVVTAAGRAALGDDCTDART